MHSWMYGFFHSALCVWVFLSIVSAPYFFYCMIIPGLFANSTVDGDLSFLFESIMSKITITICEYGFVGHSSNFSEVYN